MQKSTGAIQLAYCSSGLSSLNFHDAIEAVARAGYAGIEISFDREQFNPFRLGRTELATIRRQLDAAGVTPACVATASYFFTPAHPHEPSLIALDADARDQRIDLIRRGIDIARALQVPLVSFGSGFLRAEHVQNPQRDPQALLIESIRACLDALRVHEDITLLIEPEPGMFIETLAQGRALIEAVGSPHFRLHVDLCHAYCSEKNCLQALADAVPVTRYLHISDAEDGYNLKIIEDTQAAVSDPEFASTLVHFVGDDGFLLVDRAHPLFFADQPPSRDRRQYLDLLLGKAGVRLPLKFIHYASLPSGPSAVDEEIFTYLISVPGLAYEVLDRAKPILAYLRSAHTPPLVGKRIANTLTGIVHYHDIPGRGTLDLAASFRALTEHGFAGFGAVELYHHKSSWQSALTESYRHLQALTRPAH